MSETKEATVIEPVAEKAVSVEESAKKRTLDDAEEPVENVESEKKDGKKKKRRRQYDDDLPKETKSDDDDDESDEGDGENLDEEAGDEDELLEIDTSNIITGGRRTRGKVIDFKKAAEELEREHGVVKEDDEDEEAEFDEPK